MMDTEEITGRFLPSRVYSRWKWAVRAGLMVVPMLVLLCGGLILFLTPSTYRSTAVVEISIARTPQELAAMVKSSAVLGRVISDQGLVERLQVDHETARDLLSEAIRVKVIPDTRLIEISVTLAQKELARDVAAALPQSLVKWEAERVRDEQDAIASKLIKLTREAEDLREERGEFFSKVAGIHRDAQPDTPAFRELDQARRDFEAAKAEVARWQSLQNIAEMEKAYAEPHLTVHTEPSISQNPTNPKIGPQLDELLLQALAAGLIAALLLPYLGELAFPVLETCEMAPEVVYDL